jgi:hypothetical protein
MKLEINANLGAVLINIAVCVLIGFAVWWTKSAWCLWGLLLLAGTSSKTKTTETKDKP